jgi:predicted transcriptional regulator
LFAIFLTVLHGQQVDTSPLFLYAYGMEVRLNPTLQAKVDEWVEQTGRPADELAEDAIADYFEEVAQIRATVDDRYDDIKSGRVKLIDGEEAFARLRAMSEARRAKSE